MRDFLLTIIRISSYLILFTPLIFHSSFFFPFVAPKSLYFFALSEIIFFSWVALAFIDPKYKPKFNLLSFAILFYLFSFFLSTLFSVNPSYSFWSKYERMTGLLMQLHLVGLFLAWSSVFEREDFKKLFFLSIFISLFAGIHGVLTVKNITFRGGGFLGNESFLGTYLLFNCFFALYLIFESNRESRNIFIFLFLILVILLLFVGVRFEGLSFPEKIFALFYKTGARAAKISLYGGLVFLILLRLAFSKRKTFQIASLGILLFSLIFVSFVLYSMMFLPQSFWRALLEKEVGTFGGRFFVWEIAKKAFLERPFFGWGPESFEYPFFKFYNPCFGTEKCGYDMWYDRAHNVVFDILSSLGIVGLISYFLLFFCAVFILWKNFSQKEIDFWVFGIFTSLFASYFVQNLTVFDMVSSYLMLFLVFAFVASLNIKFLKSKFEKKKIHLTFLLVCFLMFLVSFFYFVIKPTLANINLIRAIKSKPFSKERVVFAKKALSLSPMGKFQNRQHLAQILSSQLLQEFLKVALGESQSTFFQAEVREELGLLEEELRKSIKECPFEYRSYLLLGELLTYESVFDNSKSLEGEKIIKEALKISPQNQKGYLILAQNMLFQQKPKEALSLARKAIELEPNFIGARLDFVKIAILANEIDLANEELENLKKHPEYENYIKRMSGY